MEISRVVISIYLIFSLAIARESEARASLPEADEVNFWQTIWPNTPIPSTLLDLLRSGPTDVDIGNLPFKIDETKYPNTLFFQHDLYPSKTINVEFGHYLVPARWAWREDLTNKEGETYNDVCLKKASSKGEHKFCAKSLGALINFAISKFGKNVKALSSALVDGKEEYEYNVEGVQSLGDKIVICHRMNFQKVVFYCHEINASTGFKVSLVGADGTKTEALAVCHNDTSGMNHELLHQLMGVDPGTNSVCHFLGNSAILWVPNMGINNSNIAI